MRQQNTQKVTDEAPSIGEEVAFQSAATEYAEAYAELDRLTDETTPRYQLAQQALELSSNALTAMIDAYCARRIGRALAGK